MAPPRACLCHHKREELRRARERQSKRQINETKLRRKADGRAFALAGMRSAELWPSTPTRGPPGRLADHNPNPNPNPNPNAGAIMAAGTNALLNVCDADKVCCGFKPD